MESNIKKARKEYPKGSLFFSASGALKSPLKVHSLYLSEITKDSIYNSEGGVIYDSINNIWAEKWN